MNPTDEAYKNKIGERLTRALGDGLINGTITEEEAPEISTYILENIDKAQDSAALLNFVEEVSVKWPVFSNILILEKADDNRAEENSAVVQAESLIKENKIDEALNVMGNVTNQDNQNTQNIGEQ